MLTTFAILCGATPAEHSRPTETATIRDGGRRGLSNDESIDVVLITRRKTGCTVPADFHSAMDIRCRIRTFAVEESKTASDSEQRFVTKSESK